MKKIVLILFILFTLVKIGNAQLNKPVNFPQSFIGKWEGKLQCEIVMYMIIVLKVHLQYKAIPL